MHEIYEILLCKKKKSHLSIARNNSHLNQILLGSENN